MAAAAISKIGLMAISRCHASVDVTARVLKFSLSQAYLIQILFYLILSLLTYCELKLVPLQSGHDVTHLSSDRCYTPKIYIYIYIYILTIKRNLGPFDRAHDLGQASGETYDRVIIGTLQMQRHTYWHCERVSFHFFWVLGRVCFHRREVWHGDRICKCRSRTYLPYLNSTGFMFSFRFCISSFNEHSVAKPRGVGSTPPPTCDLLKIDEKNFAVGVPRVVPC